jgi:hypothetical protein
MKLLNLLHINKFEILAPFCPTRYSPAGNDDVIHTFVHKIVRLPEIIISDILNSDHLQLVSHFLDKGSVEKQSSLVVSLKGLDPKTN